MITQIIPNVLHFDSGRFVNKEQIGRGFYFKGKFVSRYKKETIEIIRSKFNGNFPIDMIDKLPDEYAVLKYFYDISVQATKKTEEKKKPYYAELRIANEIGNIAKEIARLEFKIGKLEQQKIYLDNLKKVYQENVDKLKSTLEKAK